MKIIIIGGHLSPALAVMDLLPKDWEILFVGRKYVFEGEKSLSLEYKIINDLKIPFEEISTGRLQRKFSKNTIPSLLKLPSGFFKAFRILKKFQPDIVLGFGSYLQIPIVFASFFLKIPVVLHEQTLESGFSNSICSHFAKKICISWEPSARFFPKTKTILTGNPIRKEIIQSSEFPPKARLARGGRVQNSKLDLPLIYITGGSSGSHFLNSLIESLIPDLLVNFNVIHQTGGSLEYDDIRRLKRFRETLPKGLKENYSMHEFINPSDVGSVLRRAEFVIGRAGINTVTELIFTKKPAILIPLPFSANNEQFKNARFLENLGSALVILQKEANAQVLFSSIQSMHKSINEFEKKSKNLKDLIREDAADKIIEVVRQCVLKN